MNQENEHIIENGVHSFTNPEGYIFPKETLVQEKLEQFQDHKLGLMMHWMPGVQLGIYESWCLADDSLPWSSWAVDWTDDRKEFVDQYKNMYKSFNPVRFQPDVWADLAKEGGFQYFLFTTKHHDGFCMWDTQTTNYKITDEHCPFHTHKYRDICRHLFDEFRARNIPIHAYFSKPDWSSPYYWAPQFLNETGSADRNVNYNIADHPELWEKFVSFTHEQIRELLTNYGEIDCLWLDGGWVRPNNQLQDIRLGEIVNEIRSTTQPHLLVADRTVGGEYENIITPEQEIPDKPILVPWESCITMGEYFAFHYDDEYKSLRQLIHLLIEVVAKGGNLALNVTPQPDGRLPKKAVQTIKELGQFMNKFGESIYGTRPCDPYFDADSQVAFTKRGNDIYVFYLYREEEEKAISQILVPRFNEIKSISLLNEPIQLHFEGKGDKYMISFPDRSLDELPIVDIIKISLA